MFNECSAPVPHANLFLVGLSQPSPAEMLPDDVLLNIFRHYIHDSPQVWPTPTYICRRWRQTVLNSPLGLGLRLYCTHGKPVLRALDYFPPVPLIVSYGGSPRLYPPAPEDEENIMAALRQSDRVESISLTVTNTLVEKLSEISEPFSSRKTCYFVRRRPAADPT
jgi:hypothetical protein